MKIDFEYRELMTIQEAIEKQKLEKWNQLAKRINKAATLEEVKEIRKEFDENMNPWCDEGRYNSILKKIEDFQAKISKLMEQQ